ncbi:cbb3-type cytochrome oxidase assembly protein CcoS [Echinicola jeungdonensis]|uniref:Cbb3-type cytochrome oxidase assembly protein CcoS n=1 Tax=Echinicola jeungdonensis TaxID=709343 RepID=A0ABV5J294_9BACT|nr:cbb3-type cytochrome oxidase assembly protein CcoS [Echinicola jeungdonensis]MDN3667790.1 cbb3-type cytochrome oxidase assembly protein CcoS [Echinicola jeungdonensis]
MEVIFVLIGVSLVLAIGFLILFLRAMNQGQFDDAHTPSIRILFDKTTKENGNQKTTIKSK